MKKLLFLLPLVFTFLVGNAYAQNFAIGKQEFSYSTPPGFVELSRGRNAIEDQTLDYFISSTAIFDSAILAVFVKRDSYMAMSNSGPLKEYVTVQHFPVLADLQYSQDSFEKMKLRTGKNNINSIIDKKKDNVRDISQKLLKNDFEFSMLSEPVILRDTDNLFSFLSTIDTSADNLKTTVLSVTNLLLVEGKVLNINYYKIYEKKIDPDLVALNSEKFLADLLLMPVIAKPIQPVTQTPPPPPQPERKLVLPENSRFPLQFILMVVGLVLLLGAIGYWFYNKRKGQGQF